MRRKDRQVNSFEEIVGIISRCDVIRIGINGGEYPYIVPMNFGYETDGEKLTFYMHSAMSGRKIELLSRNKHVCFEMDCGHELMLLENERECSMAYESVMGTGDIEFVEDGDKLAALRCLMEHYRGRDFDFNQAPVQVTAVLRLTVNSVEGKRRKAR